MVLEIVTFEWDGGLICNKIKISEVSIEMKGLVTLSLPLPYVRCDN